MTVEVSQGARIEALRSALREVIVNVGGFTHETVSDEFLMLAPAEVAGLRAAERERCARIAEEYPSNEFADIPIVRGIATAIRSQP